MTSGSVVAPWCSLAPLRASFRLEDPDLPIEFGEGVRLERVPSWFNTSEIFEFYSPGDWLAIRNAEYVLRVDFRADGPDVEDTAADPDPFRDSPRTIGERNVERIQLAALALWIPDGGPATGTPLIHCPGDGSRPRNYSHLLDLILESAPPATSRLLVRVHLAAKLHKQMLELDRHGPLWRSAIRTLPLALQSGHFETRYPVMWIVLEALFGPSSPGETTYRMSQRIGFFLGGSRQEAKAIASRVKEAYRLRSDVVHGRWPVKFRNNANDLLRESEQWIRLALIAILTNGERLIPLFNGKPKNRDEFLDELVFCRDFSSSDLGAILGADDS